MTDQVRVIPQLFFDVISCYVPGVIMLCCLALALPDQSWNMLQELARLELLKGDKGGTTLAVVGAIAAAVLPYTIGALMGAPIHLAERFATFKMSPFVVPEHLWPQQASTAEIQAAQDSHGMQESRHASGHASLVAAAFRAPGRRRTALFYRLTPEAKRLILNGTPVDQRTASDLLLFDWYDYLRLRHPSVGALAAKLRAEMVMFGAFALAGALAIFVHVRYSQESHSFTVLTCSPSPR
jgi:hypothetical protein